MSLLFIYGENQFALLQKLKYYREGFLKKYGEEAIYEEIEGGKVSAQEIKALTQNVSLFAEKRFLILRNFLRDADQEEQKKLAEYLNKIEEDCIFVLTESAIPDRRTTLYKKLIKEAKSEEFKAWLPAQTTRWIVEKIQKSGGSIDSNTATYLVECTGGELFQVNSEVQKLLAFAKTKKITRADIDELTHKNLIVVIFDLMDAIGQKQLTSALKLFRNLVESGESPWQIFSMIVRQFRILILVNDLLGRGLNAKQISEKLKMHPYVIQKALPQSRNFTFKKLTEIYDKLLDLDIRLKTGKIQTTVDDESAFFLALEEFIAQVCKKEN